MLKHLPCTFSSLRTLQCKLTLEYIEAIAQAKKITLEHSVDCEDVAEIMLSLIHQEKRKYWKYRKINKKIERKKEEDKIEGEKKKTSQQVKKKKTRKKVKKKKTRYLKVKKEEIVRPKKRKAVCVLEEESDSEESEEESEDRLGSATEPQDEE